MFTSHSTLSTSLMLNLFSLQIVTVLSRLLPSLSPPFPSFFLILTPELPSLVFDPSSLPISPSLSSNLFSTFATTLSNFSNLALISSHFFSQPSSHFLCTSLSPSSTLQTSFSSSILFVHLYLYLFQFLPYILPNLCHYLLFQHLLSFLTSFSTLNLKSYSLLSYSLLLICFVFLPLLSSLPVAIPPLGPPTHSFLLVINLFSLLAFLPSIA